MDQRIGFPALVCLALIATTGCSSNPKGPERSAAAVESLRDTKDQLSKADAQVGETITSLNTLMGQNSGDLRPTFNKFSDEIRQTREMAEAASNRAAAMRERTNEYVTQWQAEQKAITDPELQRMSQERASRATAQFDRVRSVAQETRAAYQPWMQSLTDVQTFLANDLTSAGVTAAKPKAMRAVDQGNALRAKIGQLEAEIDRVAATWSSAAGR
ncbi:MAG TPA: DUF2959 family protein [Tepidisphaeraceae bacterium]|jgi:chromosome segregation ATPase